MPEKNKILKKRALLIKQNDDVPLYIFSLTGSELLEIGDISRISRDDGGKLLGYQRPEVRRHIKEITQYLDNEKTVVFPNSIILALQSTVRFVRSRGPETNDGCAIAGTLEIPIPNEGKPRPGWIVDGQQRAVALSRSKRTEIAVPVNAFVADDLELQRDQFLRVNNSKPLPRRLITDLLPAVSANNLPTRMAKLKIPAAICDWLNQDEKSPFHKLIKQASSTKTGKKVAVVEPNSIIRGLEKSLETPNGGLYRYRNVVTGETDFEGITQLLMTYWTAVKLTFPEAWGKPPSKSKLMGGVGLRSMTQLLSTIMSPIKQRGPKGIRAAKKELSLIKPICHWTSGYWDFESGQVKWSDLENTEKQIRDLSWVLNDAYLSAKESGQ